jgi:hypothetical protein
VVIGITASGGMTEAQVRAKPSDTEIIAHVARRFAIGEPKRDGDD